MLTREQTEAVGCGAARTYIEAAPGSGKTTVACERFGVLRFAGSGDMRAVVAVSFTRSATRVLRQRVLAHWGPVALSWPHRVVTIDTLVYEILTYLLRNRLIRWPGGLVDLRVMDSWKVRAQHQWTRRQPLLFLSGRDVLVGYNWQRTYDSRVDLSEFTRYVEAGECTHEDVRRVLRDALEDGELAGRIEDRLGTTVRALIVDEVFDANPLDLALVERACAQGIAVTVIGDPWQALYRFRGAGPELVPGLLQRHTFERFPLTHSFRFRSQEAQILARDLRAKHPVTLAPRGERSVDVVLAGRWNALWEIGGDVLPLSFGSPNGPPAAAALLLLDHLCFSTIGQHAVFLDDALTNLGVTDPRVTERLADRLQAVLMILRQTSRSAVNDAWEQLVAAIGTESLRAFPHRHHTHTARLKKIRELLLSSSANFVPGLTVHQAKGREWKTVGVRLTPDEKQYLLDGIDQRVEEQRQVYVALTRGIDVTLEV